MCFCFWSQNLGKADVTFCLLYHVFLLQLIFLYTYVHFLYFIACLYCAWLISHSFSYDGPLVALILLMDVTTVGLYKQQET
jgi:hypothetical protein